MRVKSSSRRRKKGVREAGGKNSRVEAEASVFVLGERRGTWPSLDPQTARRGIRKRRVKSEEKMKVQSQKIHVNKRRKDRAGKDISEKHTRKYFFIYQTYEEKKTLQ